MRKPEQLLGVTVYEATRSILPDLCRMMGCRIVRWTDFDHAPTTARQVFIDFAKGILDGVFQFVEDEGATTTREAKCEQENETTDDG